MRVELPDGEWAEFCAARKVSERRRRAWLAASADATAATAGLPRDPADPAQPDSRYMTGEHTLLQMRVFDLLVWCFLKAWSLPPEPSLEALEDLDTGTKDTLTRAAMAELGDLMPDFGDNPMDPKALSGGSTRPGLPSSTAAATSETPSFAAIS